MLAVQHLARGTRLRLVDGGLVEIHENPRDGTWLVVHRVAPDGSTIAEEDLVHVDEIADLAPG